MTPLPASLAAAAGAVEHARTALDRAVREGRDYLATAVVDPRARHSEADITHYQPGRASWDDAQADIAATVRHGLIGVLASRSGRRVLLRVVGEGASWESRS